MDLKKAVVSLIFGFGGMVVLWIAVFMVFPIFASNTFFGREYASFPSCLRLYQVSGYMLCGQMVESTRQPVFAFYYAFCFGGFLAQA
ncbi:hypothetical protein HY772_09290 [Candidatus Woesearchaeota archaeon]|nr:hypothetical protein [Candidatus Woesearchaeota archaeon]